MTGASVKRQVLEALDGCLNDEEPWEGERLVELLEQVHAALTPCAVLTEREAESGRVIAATLHGYRPLTPMEQLMFTDLIALLTPKEAPDG